MLADELAALVDKGVGGFLLCGLVVPGTGEGYVHGDGGADGTCAEEEGGVTGHDLGVGECADIAHLCLVGGELAVCDHLVELEACCDTGEVAAFVDGSESVVVVSKILGVSLRVPVAVAELDIRGTPWQPGS